VTKFFSAKCHFSGITVGRTRSQIVGNVNAFLVTVHEVHGHRSVKQGQTVCRLHCLSIILRQSPVTGTIWIIHAA